ncbi:MAG: EF-hand domain-containing protein [Pseudomonadota bacterium]
MKLINRILLACAGLAIIGSATAQEHGPSLPPALRSKPSPDTPASGAALRAQAVQKLKARFEQADLDASGSLTVDEARSAGLGYVVNHFGDIDSAGRGKVSFDDLKKHLQARRTAKP